MPFFKPEITKKQKWTLGISISSFILLALAYIINEFRFELFGLIPGSAPNNFVFNFTFFIPVILITLFVSTGMLVRTLKYWRFWKQLNFKLLVLLFTLPIILHFILILIWLITLD